MRQRTSQESLLGDDRRLGAGVRVFGIRLFPSAKEASGHRHCDLRSAVCGWSVSATLLFQTFVVKPNELRVETPYLSHYIDFTRKAYKLDGIQETAYPALSDLTPDVIARIRIRSRTYVYGIHDRCFQTYQQTQAIRLYYEFYNVDVDRYHLADGYHQVMLASRELASQLPSEAQTWVNENLEFTHGEGW